MSRSIAAPLRPLGVAEVLDGSVRLVRRNVRAVLVASIPIAIATAVVNALLQYASLSSTDATVYTTVGGLLVSTLFHTLLTGVLTPVFSADVMGVRVDARQAFRQLSGRGWPLVALALVVTVSEAAGLIALVVGGVWLWGVWALAAPALIIERTSVRGALARSFRLVQRHFWRVWGVRALGWLLTSILSLLLSTPFQVLASYVTDYNPLATRGGTPGQPGLYVAIIACGTLLSAAFLRPIAAAVDVLLYTDQRMRAEGMDIVLGLAAGPSPMARPVSAW